MWSFDVYDTCLTRNYAHPKDVFREVAVNNSSELERQLGEGWIEIFSDARHQAQSLASEAKQGGEPSLIEIYKQVKKALPFIQSTNYIASELQIEQESLRPCSETKELVMLARGKYGRVIFISDMYLPHKFIKDALIKHSFFYDNDILYVSSSYPQESKSNGRLFKRVLHDLNLRPHELTHHGDNSWSDIAQARYLSIRPKHIKTCNLSRHEQAIYKSTSIISELLASRLIGHIRTQRIGSQKKPIKSVYDDVTNNFSGPVLWLFAEWIILKSVRNKSREIYLCSRDCLGLMVILERLIKLKSINLKLRYFATSRQALVLSTIRKGSTGLNLEDLQEALNGLKIKEILKKTGIDRNRYLQFMRTKNLESTNLENKLDAESKWNMFWECLEEPVIRRELNELAAREQDSALKHFQEIGLSTRSRKTIVDFGWRQNCQSMIMDLLKNTINTDEVIFLYLGLKDRRNLRAIPSRNEALFYGSDSQNGDYISNEISRLVEKTQLIEVLMSCDPSDSIRSYRSDHPNCRYKLTGELKLRKEMNMSIQRFSKSIHKNLPSNEYDLRLTTIKLMDYWLENPKKQWRSLFKEVETIKEAFRDSDTIIAEPLHFHYKHLTRSRFFPIVNGKRASGSRAWQKLALSNTSLIGYLLFLPALMTTRIVFLYSRRLSLSEYSRLPLARTKNWFFTSTLRLKKAILDMARSILFILRKNMN